MALLFKEMKYYRQNFEVLFLIIQHIFNGMPLLAAYAKTQEELHVLWFKILRG